ncbi:thiamine diphosphokinase [Tropicimonas sp. IMCC6043]|uniref:thiamine diphosphokinase n=1 Tax=Tropicimonas sp. IMCC6043 TaxID=2510645 RepID=UPI00101DA787|nr:thiamine diphosphokinase [Tropicimonas sp. IMCC6043]RYH09572.1 thiamine diphosphokinase [Tropicimonas sp. IMCC6043]
MDDHIFRDSRGITLLGGGDAATEDLNEALALAPCLVAVDGGAETALAAGVTPRAVIGDMDSLPEGARTAIPADRLHEIPEQDSTDFDKALRSVAAPLVLGVGFLGRRIDHQLANLNVLVRRAERRCILIGTHDVVFAAPAQIRLDLDPGSRVSLFPMAPISGRSQGLHWPIEGLDMAPGAGIGTSNRVEEAPAGPVALEFPAPGMLVILPRAALAAAVAGLARAEPFVPAG